MASSVIDQWPSYSPQQLHELYERIELPSKFRYEPGDFSKEVVRHRDGVGFLGALQRFTLATVPFENLELHYSSHHQVSIHPDALFEKIVTQRTGRGGYCLENNVFLGTAMRSLGFQVISVGARMNSQIQPRGEARGHRRFGGFSHMVNLVTIRGDTYMVDVGFGAGGPTHPLPLKESGAILNLPPNQNVRLRRDVIPEMDSASNKLWMLERKIADEGPWVALYCFEDNVCFLPQDFEVMNFFTSTHRMSFFTFRVVASKYVLDELGDMVVGYLVLYEDSLQRRVRGEREILQTFQTEQERIDALKDFMGIKLSASQRAGIKGMVTEIVHED